MDNTKHRRLQELDRSDFEIVDGEPDIRGWDVKNDAGIKIGEVEELIVDAQKKKVRYIVVDLDDNELKLSHRKVLIPIGLAELHKDGDDVILPTVTVDHLGALPEYEKDHLDEEAERRVCSVLGRDTSSMAQSILSAANVNHSAKQTEQHDDFYRHEYFHDDNLYKHRQHEAQPVNRQRTEDSEYEKGLRLWELRSEGGTINQQQNSRRQEREREVNEERQMEMVRNRRREYEERRNTVDRGDHRSEHHHHRDNSIIGRIRDEGMQDAE